MSLKYYIRKLLLGKPEYNTEVTHKVYLHEKNKVLRIWNNEKHDDIGIEKTVRLFLACSQFVFPGILIRSIFAKRGLVYKTVAIDFYVVIKLLIQIIILSLGLYTYTVAKLLTCYLLIETVLYIATLIFVSDMFAKPRSYKRSILLLFVNYIEITLGFSVLYGGWNVLSKEPLQTLDYIYFSFITSATIGYGDLHPITSTGKILTCVHSMLLLVFVVLFINFFSSRVETINYETEH